MAWIAEQYNNPSLTDYYLMLLAAEVRAKFAKNPNDIKIKDFKLEFGSNSKQPHQPDKAELETATAIAKARWNARLGIDINRGKRS